MDTAKPIESKPISIQSIEMNATASIRFINEKMVVSVSSYIDDTLFVFELDRALAEMLAFGFKNHLGYCTVEALTRRGHRS